jgi:hypothetical protein
MDSLVSSAARALSAGDPLGALKRIALRDDPPALALRGMKWATFLLSLRALVETGAGLPSPRDLKIDDWN